MHRVDAVDQRHLGARPLGRRRTEGLGQFDPLPGRGAFVAARRRVAARQDRAQRIGQQVLRLDRADIGLDRLPDLLLQRHPAHQFGDKGFRRRIGHRRRRRRTRPQRRMGARRIRHDRRLRRHRLNRNSANHARINRARARHEGDHQGGGGLVHERDLIAGATAPPGPIPETRLQADTDVQNSLGQAHCARLMTALSTFVFIHFVSARLRQWTDAR